MSSVFGARPAARRRSSKQAGLDPGLAARLKRRILIVDDVPVNQKVAKLILERCGYTPDVAANGLEAIAALERAPYDLLFMDLQMPGMGGLEATREIRRRLPHARQPHIIGLSRAASDEDREACLAAGMNNQYTKPLRVEEMVTAIIASNPARCPPPTGQASRSLADAQ